MPFSGPSSYLQTIDEFLGHWADVDLDLAPNPLILSGDYGLIALQTDRDDLAAAIADLEGFVNQWEGHRTNRDNSKVALRERMRQFGNYVKGLLPDSSFVGQVPGLVPFDSNSGTWIRTMDDYSHMWAAINATPPAGFTPPLVLNGPYPHATFVIDTDGLRATYTALTGALQDVNRIRVERDDIYFRVREQLIRYRVAVPGLFPADHPLVLSLPRLDPLPGHTPDPVVLSGEWNAVTGKADLAWTASDDADLLGYSVRRSPFDPYDTSTESVVETVGPEVLSLSTTDGVGGLGMTSGFKVYVRLNTGNEAGSNTVTITNPGLPIPP